MLITYALAGFTATLQGKYPSGTLTPVLTFLATGGTFRFSGAVFSEVVPSADDVDPAWFTVPDGPYPPFEGLPSLGALNGVPFVTVGTGPGFNFPVVCMRGWRPGSCGGSRDREIGDHQHGDGHLFICESDRATPLERDNRLSGPEVVGYWSLARHPFLMLQCPISISPVVIMTLA